MENSPVTDARRVALPELPAGWKVTTRTKTHLTCFCPDAGRAIAIFPTGSGHDGERGWTALCLTGYGSECPRLAHGSEFEEALAEAVEEMQAVIRGEPYTAGVGVESDCFEDSEMCEDGADAESGDGEDGEIQSSLSECCN